MKAVTCASCVLLAGLLSGAMTNSCHGQVARYQPRTSTVSPYLNLGRFNTGGLPNYFALVRPQIQQKQFNTQASRTAQLQATEIASLQRQLQQGAPTSQEATTGTNSWFMTPGTQHSFLNTSQFYPQRLPRGR